MAIADDVAAIQQTLTTLQQQVNQLQTDLQGVDTGSVAATLKSIVDSFNTTVAALPPVVQPSSQVIGP